MKNNNAHLYDRKRFNQTTLMARTAWGLLALCLPSSFAIGQTYNESGGLVIMEMESTPSPLDLWQQKTDLAGYTGSGFLQFNGNNFASGPATSPLTYRFTINQAGLYYLHLHCAKEEHDGRDDVANDCYVRVEGDYTAGPGPHTGHGDNASLALLQSDTKYFGGAIDSWKWENGQNSSGNAGNLDPGGESNKRIAVYDFKAGETYTLTVSGRSKFFRINRIMFRHTSVAENTAQNLSNPESSTGSIVYNAIDDFPVINAGDIPYYEDNGNDALAIAANIVSNRTGFARATRSFDGPSGSYDVTITTLTEEDGESTYRLLVNGVVRASYENPSVYDPPDSPLDLQPNIHTWRAIPISNGDTLAIESNAHTNGEIPENGGTAWARGRWRHIELTTSTDLIKPPAGRLAVVADGNSADPDDIGATAVMFGILKGSGLRERLVHLSHSCDLDPTIGGNPISASDELRRQAVLHELCGDGIGFFGPFDNLSNYYNCRSNQTAAVSNLTAAINASSAGDPLWIVEAGEPDIIGYALQDATPSQRQYVQVISHHPANDNSGDFFTWAQILAFGVTEHQIGDQNVGLQTTIPPWDWAFNHVNPGIAWIWDRLKYAEQDGVVGFQDNKFDCSDAGMVYWWITGADNGGNNTSTPVEMREMLLAVNGESQAPIAHWRLDEGAGTVANDTSGRGFTGTLLNGASWGSDATRSNYVAFDGSNDRISTLFTYALTASDTFTWAWWANRATTNDTGAIMVGNRYPQPGPGGETYEFIKFTPTAAQFSDTDNTAEIHRYNYADIAVDGWHHYAMTKSGTNYQWYVDGVAVGSPHTFTYDENAPLPFSIGGDDDGSGTKVNEHFEGGIDDVVLYNRALSATEVANVRDGMYGFNGPAVTNLMLINADTDADIGAINDGDTLYFSQLPTTNLNIRAEVTTNGVGSVRFALDGNPNFQTESIAPYALVGDTAGDYNPWTPALGAHTLTATPFSEAGAAGIPGTPRTINFTVQAAPTTGSALITGELKKWHKLTLSWDGPVSSETAATNPFSDYRVEVTFSHAGSGKSYPVPGYFAADGNAAESSADAGNVWRAHFAPDEIGEWTYAVTFRSGTDIAMSNAAGTSAGFFDGESGTFLITATDKSGHDLRGKGRLQYVGKHHLQFAETGEYFLKAGADAPENFLAYDDFDDTPNDQDNQPNLRKSWNPHAGDYHAATAAPFTWQGGKGTEILGAVRYLSQKGMNVFSFLTFSVDGDDDNVFPHRLKSTVSAYEAVADNARWAHADGVHHDRFDVSKMGQWERVLEYAGQQGMYLHFKTQETENDQRMDGGALGRERMLYYRELIARFGHHLALNWNLGEENTNTEAQQKAFAQWFYDNDPYRHNVVLHTYPGDKSTVYTPLLGSNSRLTGLSLQTNQADFRNVFSDTLSWVQNSAGAGVPWVVACDEPGDAQHALRPAGDEGNSWIDGRKNALWGNIMAGGAGVEFYFGYGHAHSDLTCQDFRSRDGFWDTCRHALNFFRNHHVPFQDMVHANSLVSGAGNNANRCLAKTGEAYVVQLYNGGSHTLDLSAEPAAPFIVRWFDPRNGGTLFTGDTVTGGATVNLGTPPNNSSEDWIALVTPNMPMPGPIAHWPLDEAVGSVANDVTGNGYTGTIATGANWATDGTRGSHVSFDGIDGHISTLFSYTLTASSDFTWAWWANRSATNDFGAIMVGNRYPSPGAGGETFEFIKHTPVGSQFADTDVVGNIERYDYTDIAPNGWHHYAMTKSGTSYQWYVDGVAEGSPQTINYNADTPLPFFIGGDDAGQFREYFLGSIDDVVLYNRSLSPTEVVQVISGIYDGSQAPLLDHSLNIAGGDLTFDWADAGYKLQTCTDLILADWVDVPGGNTSPVVISTSGSGKYFRLVEE
jgi:hypothetical protein